MNSSSQISLEEFEQIFKLHYPELCGFANSFVQDLEVAEEVVQTVFVKFWEKRTELNVSSFKSYLYSAVKNGCINQLKHFKIRDDYKEHNQRELDQNSVDVNDEMEASELEEQIHASINKLPESRRKIFILSRYEGLKYREIAEKLNISIKTVENQMGSAIKQLRTDLAEFLVTFLILLFTIR